jgi:hemin uptake protein HemP
MTRTPPPQPPARPKSAAPRASSRVLFAGQREVIIQHEQEEYRLRLTASNKLILVK